jgi:hypothetical protein
MFVLGACAKTVVRSVVAAAHQGAEALRLFALVVL